MSVYRKAGGAWSLLPDSNAIYVKVAGAWTPIGTAKPTGPASLTGTAGNAQVALSWPAATVPWGTVTEYQVQATNFDWTTGVVGTQTVTGTSYTWTGLTNGTPYWFRVRARSSEGVWGEWKSTASTVSPVSPWNVATGGAVADVPNYNGTGQTWRVHTFTANDTLTVTAAPQPFRTLIVGGGGSGGNGGQGISGGGGGAGRMVEVDSLSLSAQAYPVVVGNGGSGGQGGNGGASTFAGHTAPGGGSGGNESGGPGSNGGSGGGGGLTFGGDTTYGIAQPGTPVAGYGNNGSTSRGSPQSGAGGGGGAGGVGTLGGGPGAGRDNNITGTNVTYAQGGQGGLSSTARPANTGHGGHGGNNAPGGAGGSGIVVVAYRIA